MGFAENVVRLRKQRGWTQIDLGIKADINPKTLSSYENGRTEPNLGEVVKLCKVFDCSIAYLTDTKEREPGDITVEDIMFKLPSLSKDELLRVKEHIKMLINQRDDILRMEEERRKIEAEKAELKQKLAEYDRMIETLNVAGVRRNKNDI